MKAKIKFTEEQLNKIVRLYVNENKSVEYIRQKFNVSATTIKSQLKKKNIKLRWCGYKKIVVSKYTEKKIISLHQIDNKTLREIAFILQLSRGTITSVLSNNNITTTRKVRYTRQEITRKYNAKPETKLKKQQQWQAYKNYLQTNPVLLEKLKQYRREYAQLYRIVRRSQHHKRYQADFHYKLNHILRSAVTRSLKRKKAHHLFDILPFSIEQLKTHLEPLFTDGMSWENYGKGGWHIDHIKPISSFTFTSENDLEFKECWALSNLQPLWETTRIINGVEYIGNLNKSTKILS